MLYDTNKVIHPQKYNTAVQYKVRCLVYLSNCAIVPDHLEQNNHRYPYDDTGENQPTNRQRPVREYKSLGCLGSAQYQVHDGQGLVTNKRKGSVPTDMQVIAPGLVRKADKNGLKPEYVNISKSGMVFGLIKLNGRSFRDGQTISIKCMLFVGKHFLIYYFGNPGFAQVLAFKGQAAIRSIVIDMQIVYWMNQVWRGRSSGNFDRRWSMALYVF